MKPKAWLENRKDRLEALKDRLHEARLFAYDLSKMENAEIRSDRAAQVAARRRAVEIEAAHISIEIAEIEEALRYVRAS
jgi:hypothetical protein